MVRTGFNDPSSLMNVLRGGSVKWNNQAFGSSGNANNGSLTQLAPADGSEWAYWCTIFSNLEAKGVTLYRTGGHDPQAWQVFMQAGKERSAEAILTMLDAAKFYGIRCIVTLGGMSDPNTAPQAYPLYDLTAGEAQRFMDLAAFVADQCHGHEALELLELLNEPDFVTAMKYWRGKFPNGYLEVVNAFAMWQDGMISGTKGRQSRPGVPLGMGTAVDGTLYADRAGNPCMDWYGEMYQPNIIPRCVAGMDVITVHCYVNESSSVHRDVWTNQKIPAFVAAAKAVGKRLIIGETGALWQGGTYDAQMAQVLDGLGLDRCWMVRWWTPTQYEVPAIPPRVPLASPIDTPAPVETEPPATPTPPSTDSSPPAQDTPVEPPAVEPPAVVEPPVDDHPAEEKPPSAPVEPQVRQGQGFAIAQMMRLVFEIIGRMFRKR